MKKIKILLITLMITALSPLKVFADKSDDTLVAAFSRELTQLDYHYGTKTEFLILGDMIDSGLFYVKREDLSYAPDIASDFKIIDDRTIDINLRKNAKFHDGSEVTADDVVYTYNFIVKNEKNRRSKKIKGWMESIEKTGKHSIRFKSKYPYANLFNDLYRIKIRKNGIMGTEGNWNDSAQLNTLNGTGPYKVVSFDPGVEVVLKRNEDYYGGPKRYASNKKCYH